MKSARIFTPAGAGAFVWLFLVAGSSCGPAPGSEQELSRIFEEEWQFELRENPLFATSVGVHEFDDRLPHVDEASQRRRAEFTRTLLDRLDKVDRSELGPADQISMDILRLQLQDRLEDYRFRTYLLPILSDSGFHTDFVRLPQEVPLQSLHDYENYIARLGAFRDYMQEQIELMREGLQTGLTISQVVLNGYEEPIQAQIVEDPSQSSFFEPFRHFAPGIAAERQEELRDAARRAISESVVPAYAAFLDFIVREYRPGARRSVGAFELPNGQAYYAHLIRHFTTLDLSAGDIHERGLAEVARIRQEMDSVIQKTGFPGDFEEFLAFLREDPRFYAVSQHQLLAEASYIAKKMDGKLPSLFKTLPRLPYTVEPVPAELAPKYTAGRYLPAPVGGTRPGIYWVNTYALKSRPLYTLEALTLHESVPGHHLQYALKQELQGLPRFRQFSEFDAFGEGWGLYAEFLGQEAGFYQNPYSQFGRLTYEMWRACRLVVDTGLHAMGWTREKAIDYLAANTALSLREVETEIDRYISWPGQALAYKIGEMKIRELRSKAQKALGQRFDLREFHDAVLANGAIPLSLLDDEIGRFIRDRQESPR